MTISVRTDRRLIRTDAISERYLRVSYVAPEAPPRAERSPVNVALVLDRSGSMSGERKFDLAREAVEQSLRMLHPEDRFSLVIYDQLVDVLHPSSFATGSAKRHALDALRDIRPRGATDLCAGWMRGCEQVAEHLDADGVSRALLLTDGLANSGTRDHETLVRHAGELKRRGVATSTFGVGSDFDERLLRDLARDGGGNFYFIENPAQIPDLLTSELGEALETVARDVTLRITLPDGADAEPLNSYRHSRRGSGLFDENELRVELGDLVSAQDVRVVIRVELPKGELGDLARAAIALEGRGINERVENIEWSYAPEADNDHQPRDIEIDREVASLYAARARAEATEANRRRDFSSARRILERAAESIGNYAADDAGLQDIMTTLRADTAQFARQAMSPVELKRAFYRATVESVSRSPEGKARRKLAEEILNRAESKEGGA
jgi:Ca-activated chloride channel family protein